MKSVKKSDFVSLVNYLADAQEKNERVTYTSVTNCASIDVNAAVIEVTAIQGMNTRAESDKTYHLILSFRAGERPDDSILAAIESKICEGLGYGEHQRVSVAHDDTDNFHLHIAINKIHPTRLTIHSPYNDHKTLGKLCAALEIEYGLEKDNHQPLRVASENRALDMEHHAGVESLLGWIKRECLEQLQAACSWADLHRVLQEHGLELKERGNGLVISDQKGLMVKASSVALELSKAKLIDRFGEFNSQALPVNTERATKKYEARPLWSRIDTTLIFARYKNEQQGRGVDRAKGLKEVRAKRDRSIAELKRKSKLKRATTKLAGGSPYEKKLLYVMISQSVKGELNTIGEQYGREREWIVKLYRPLQWVDWLRREAAKGDQEALAALRARVVTLGLKGNTVSAKGGELKRTGVKADQVGVTKKGTVIYHVGASAVRDDGDRLKVSRGATREGLEAALRLAMERYGTHITVNGTAEFKAHIVEVAAKARLQVTFADATLELKRVSLVNHAPKASHSFAAVDQYLAEREQKRQKILDIMEHRRYTVDDLGVASFAGVRRIDGESLALLKRDQVILVMPIDDKTANCLSRLSIGDQVTCTGIGVVKTKGRSR